MINYDVHYVADGPGSPEVFFDYEQYDRMLGSLILNSEVELDLTVSTHYSSKLEAMEVQTAKMGAKVDQVWSLYDNVFSKVGIHSFAPSELPTPEQARRNQLEKERIQNRYDDKVCVQIHTTDDKLSNQRLALMTYLWSVQANGMESSGSWYNKLIASRVFVPIISATAFAGGAFEVAHNVAEQAVPASIAIGSMVGGVTMLLGKDLIDKLNKHNDPDFDHAVDFAVDYVASNPPIIQTIKTHPAA